MEHLDKSVKNTDRALLRFTDTIHILRGMRWRTTLQAGRSRFRFKIMSIQFFIDMALGFTQVLIDIYWGVKAGGA